MGRDLQAAAGQSPQTAMTLPLLTGLDGAQKMSKSYDNYVAFEDPPEIMYRKLLGLPESLLEDYLRLTTDMHPDEVDALIAAWQRREVTTSDVTERLAHEIVALYYGAETAETAQTVETVASASLTS